MIKSSVKLRPKQWKRRCEVAFPCLAGLGDQWGRNDPRNAEGNKNMKPDILLSPFYLSSSHSSLPQALSVCKHVAFPQSERCSGGAGAQKGALSTTEVSCPSSTHGQLCFLVSCDFLVISFAFSCVVLFRLWPCLLMHFLRWKPHF